MPKPQNVSPEKYQTLRVQYHALRDQRVALETQRSQSGAAQREPFSLAVCDAQIAELEALIAAEEGGAAFNRSAGDLEGIRTFLEAELVAARAVLATAAPQEPAPLASASAKDLAAYLASVEQYRADYAAHCNAVAPAHARLAMAYAAASQAQQIVWAQRKAAGHHAPSNVVPQQPDMHTHCPGTIDAIDRDLATLEAQRHDASPNGVVSSTELRLHALRAGREEHLAAEAAAATAAE